MASVTATQAFTLAADAVYLRNRPLPTAPDGYYDWQLTGNPADKTKGHSFITNWVTGVSDFITSQGALFDLSPQIQAFLTPGGYKPQRNDIARTFPYHCVI